MKRFIIALLILSVAVTIGCDVNPSKMSQEYANEAVTKITYAIDTETGFCFAFITSRKTGDTDQTGMGMSIVPCKHLTGE